MTSVRSMTSGRRMTSEMRVTSARRMTSVRRMISAKRMTSVRRRTSVRHMTSARRMTSTRRKNGYRFAVATYQPAVTGITGNVKRRKLKCYGQVSRSSGLAKTILQRTVKGGRRQGRQRKRWEDNVWEWTSLELAKSQGQWRT